MCWHKVATLDDVVINSGICLLVEGQQVALFCMTAAGEPQFFAIGNYDPIGKANVLSRGITGSVGERLVVASPLYKQHFDLQTGQCLEYPDISVPVYPVKLAGQQLWLETAYPSATASFPLQHGAAL